MEETESQLVSVLKLSYSRAHVLNHHTIETKKLMNEWMIVGDESRWLLVIWRQINLIRAYLDQSHFQLLFSISYLGTARWHHNLFVYPYNFLPPVPAKYKTEVLLTNVSGCLTYLNSWEVWAWQHWAQRMKATQPQLLFCIMLRVGDGPCPSPVRVSGDGEVNKAPLWQREAGEIFSSFFLGRSYRALSFFVHYCNTR